MVTPPAFLPQKCHDLLTVPHHELVLHPVFEDDGDYTFTLAFQDLAGNRAVYGQTDEFTIDKTAPELEVSWDNQDVCNEIYFADSRTAVIDILERNFKEELIDITVTAEGDAEEVPAASAWIQNGEHHTARIRFMEDGIYTLTVKGKDFTFYAYQFITIVSCHFFTWLNSTRPFSITNRT